MSTSELQGGSRVLNIEKKKKTFSLESILSQPLNHSRMPELSAGGQRPLFVSLLR